MPVNPDLATPWAATEPNPTPYPWRWFAFAAVLLASIMDLLDALVTNIAAPSIRADIGGGPALIQWLGAGYTLAMAAGLVTGGRLGDILGRRTVFLVGTAGFALSSALCAVSVSPGMLIASRVAQGLFGAVMLPQGLGVIRSVFPPKELATAFGAYGPAMGLSSVAGPVLAGALINADIFGTGWRMIFLINLPLSLLALLGGARFIPRGQARGTVRLDVLGALLAAGAALLMVYPVVQGRELGWPAWAFVCMAASLIFSLTLTLFVQVGLGFSPLKAGLTSLPQAIGSMFGFVAAGAGLAGKLGRRALHLGTAAMLIGAMGVFVTVGTVGVGLSPWQLAPSLVLYGAGMGLFLAPFFDIVLAGVEPHEYGSASGTLTAVQQFGSALGVAVLGTVFFGILGGHVADATDTVAPSLRTQLTAAHVTAPEQERILSDIRSCGRDRAAATDPAAVPHSCAQLDHDVRAAAASTDATAVRSAVQQSSVDATREGFSTTIQQTLWTVVGLLILTFALAFLLPRRARDNDPARTEPTYP